METLPSSEIEHFQSGNFVTKLRRKWINLNTSEVTCLSLPSHSPSVASTLLLEDLEKEKEEEKE